MRCKVKQRLKKNLPYLQILHKASPRVRRSLINTAPNDLIHTLGECSLQILTGAQPISPQCKEKLRKYRVYMRQLASSPRIHSYSKKRKILVQKGGFLGVILSSLLSGLLSKLTS